MKATEHCFPVVLLEILYTEFQLLTLCVVLKGRFTWSINRRVGLLSIFQNLKSDFSHINLFLVVRKGKYSGTDLSCKMKCARGYLLNISTIQ